jgi:hypothetical protein
MGTLAAAYDWSSGTMGSSNISVFGGMREILKAHERLNHVQCPCSNLDDSWPMMDLFLNGVPGGAGGILPAPYL